MLLCIFDKLFAEDYCEANKQGGAMAIGDLVRMAPAPSEDPTPENWGSNKKPGPAQLAGWKVMGYTVIESCVQATGKPGPNGLLRPTFTTIYSDGTDERIQALRSEGYETRFAPRVDSETGVMAARTVQPFRGQVLSIVARALSTEAAQEPAQT